MNDFHERDLFHSQRKEDVLFEFQGAITRQWLNEFYGGLDNRFEKEIADPRLRKKVNYILLESLQNLFHHSETTTHDKTAQAPHCIVYKEGDRLRIVCGNVLPDSQIENLKSKINHINSKSAEELKTYYQETLIKNELSSKGCAGLGLIEMARKSGHPLEYSFRKLDGPFSYFTLTMTINK